MDSRSERRGFDQDGRDFRTYIIHEDSRSNGDPSDRAPWGTGVADLRAYVRVIDYYRVLCEDPFIFTRNGNGIWLYIDAVEEP